jgi:hypothetical protein
MWRGARGEAEYTLKNTSDNPVYFIFDSTLSRSTAINLSLHSLSTFLDRRARSVLAALIIVYFSAIVIGTDFLRAEPWHDEHHYIKTVQLFVNSFSPATMKSYAEMHPPLGYMLYALTGIALGDRVWVYRLFTMACAIAALWTLFAIMRRIMRRDLPALAITALFMANPYVVGLSVFVFCDIPGMLFLLLALLAAFDKRYWLFGVMAALSLLCRQFNVYAPAAVALWALLDPQTALLKEKLRFSIAALLCLCPLIGVFVFWGDIAPPNGMHYWNPSRVQGFHPEFTVAYVAMFAVYCAPVAAFAAKCIFTKWRTAAALAVGTLYFLFPIRPSPLAIEQAGKYTVGFFDRLLMALTHGNTALRDGFYYLSFVAGLALLSWCVQTTVRAVRTQSPRYRALLLLGLLTLLFLAVLTFTFVMWEKYLIIILPFLAAWILLAREEERGIADCRMKIED